MLKEIRIALVLPHPENCNKMKARTLAKLKRHIERTGCYEPIIVRPHPKMAGRFQVIHGHNRLEVLKALGRTSAQCIVWNVDDEQTRLYLATLNRLSGKDVPESRAILLSSLLESFGLEELAALLPEERDQLAEIERFAHVDPDELSALSAEKDDGAPRVILEFFLNPDGAREVNAALDLVACRHPEMTARSDALVQLARFYLSANRADARAFRRQETRRTKSPTRRALRAEHQAIGPKAI